MERIRSVNPQLCACMHNCKPSKSEQLELRLHRRASPAVTLGFLNIYGMVLAIPNLLFIICLQKLFSFWMAAIQIQAFGK